MRLRRPLRAALGSALALALYLTASPSASIAQEARPTPLALRSARISIAGTSNIHAYTASTTEVRLTRVQLSSRLEGAHVWDEVLERGAVESFEVAVPAATLSSPKDGLDKNMHKALKVDEHADITFRLLRLEPRADVPGAMRGIGMLRVAGVEREVALEITTERSESGLTVRGQAQLLMTDYGIKPPTAMLGMLKTDPKITVTFETVLAIPLT
jgi:polyisoprenoid-binding protein YceI